MGEEFARPAGGFRYKWGGMKLNSTPNSLPVDKYAMAVNVRALGDDTLQTRPGLTQRFSITQLNSPVTDMRAYTALSSNNLPRVLAVSSGHYVNLDNGNQVGLLTSLSPLVTLIPFRPNASPTPWMYIANGADYQKFSSPGVGDVVVQANVGIAEPQDAPDAGVTLPTLIDETAGAANWTQGGTAAGPADFTRSTEAITSIIADPIVNNRWSLAVTGNNYNIGQTVFSTGTGLFYLVSDTIYPSPTSTISVASILYYSGTTGRCVIVPSGLPVSGNVPSFEGNSPKGASYLTPEALPNIRRGSLISIGGEVCLVLAVSTGPGSQVCIETSTTLTHAAGVGLALLQTIVIDEPLITGTNVPSGSIAADAISSAITAGVATLDRTVNFFFAPSLLSGSGPQDDDYLHISLMVDVPTAFTEIRILFDVGDGSFTQDYFYYTVRQNDLAAAIAATTTQLAAAQTVAQRAAIDALTELEVGNLAITNSGTQQASGASQWAEITFPIRAMTRVGTGSNGIASTNGVRLEVIATGSLSLSYGGLSTWGQGQPDVGAVGSPYYYRVRPRSSITGVRGNPSPSTRYGVNPRRQLVTVKLPSAAYDPQIDTWDIFRYGGTVTSWRFIGSTPSINTTFPDDYFDTAAEAGEALDFDNFEPWPSIDVPNNGTATSVSGTLALLSLNTIPNQDPARYLPGTLVQLGGLNVYTLRSRPVAVAGGYRVEFVENAGAASNIPFRIQEPLLARQFLPYMWGSDANGTLFACGDPLRPGTLSFAKNYAPDAAPDSYNIEISPPSEPLLGGEVLDGLPFVASSERWWALYAQPQDPRQRYSVIQQPINRGLAAPAGHCNDGVRIFFWAKDGICSSATGSLTDADLYNLFPHEGVVGQNVVYNGVTAYAPDYSRAVTFRLTYSNGYLYAIYQDSDGNYRMLTLDLDRMAWCVDDYAARPVTCVYHVEQPAGSLSSTPALYPVTLMAQRWSVADPAPSQHATVGQQRVNVNDSTVPISCVLATAEWEGGDLRAPKQWGDLFLDSIKAAAPGGLLITPTYLGAPAAPLINLATNAARVRQPIGLGGIVVTDFLGLMAAWTDDFTRQTVPTQLFLWQTSFTVQPSRAIAWYTFGSSFGLHGYMHVRQLEIAWVSAEEDILLTPISYDGQSAAPITLPATGGAYRKAVFPLTANKGLLYKFSAVSTQPFQIFLDDSEVYVGEWGREGDYLVSHNFGGARGREAVI